MTNCSTSTHLQITPEPSLSKFQHPSAADYLIVPPMKKFFNNAKTEYEDSLRTSGHTVNLEFNPKGQKSKIEKET